MTFDLKHKPNRDKLSPETVLLMDKVFYSRRAKGLNVQFNNEGQTDEWSFNDRKSRDGFIAKLSREGTEYAVSVAA